jgi:hypothetical protein
MRTAPVHGRSTPPTAFIPGRNEDYHRDPSPVLSKKVALLPSESSQGARYRRKDRKPPWQS